MTDDPELRRLKARLQSAPVPAERAKSAALARAMAAFEENLEPGQDLATEPRFSDDRPPKAGFLNGVREMMKSFDLRGFLITSTSATAVIVGWVALSPELQFQSPIVPRQVDEVPVALTAPDMAASKQAAPEEVPMNRLTGAALGLVEPSVADAPAQAVAPLRLMPAPEPEAVMLTEPAPIVEAHAPNLMPETEAFGTFDDNPVKITARDPVSTFSIDVDTASYALIRDQIENYGELPERDMVRLEELINYFPYDYPAPTGDAAPFRPDVEVFATPWNPGTRLVRIGIQGRLPEVENRPPLNLVFLIDTSGSMDEPNKLPLLKQSLSMMLGKLRPEDQVAIVAYAGSAGEVLPPTAASDKAKIVAALDRLQAGGSTAGAEGLELAYQIAEQMTAKGEISRILLATDGDFNVGVSDPDGLEAFVARKRATGTYLSVLGFGRGNLDDQTMQVLAQNGNGSAAYIDSLQEARKVLVDQIAGEMFPIADDVKIQIEWNPSAVAEYRLLGYETRALATEDFNNDRVDAGEIGAGKQVTALYEVTAPGSAAVLNTPSRYAPAPLPTGNADELGYLQIRWKDPGASTSQLIAEPILNQTVEPSDDSRFAAAIAAFGQFLRGGQYLGAWYNPEGFEKLIALAEGSRGRDEYGYRVEAVNLMRMVFD